ncbi:hypothetical protein TNCV_4371511 [Trichonephila clavipes]|nr:hypothetical protein TNCV_4371511 [Trichonephila clavipes]
MLEGCTYPMNWAFQYLQTGWKVSQGVTIKHRHLHRIATLFEAHDGIDDQGFHSLLVALELYMEEKFPGKCSKPFCRDCPVCSAPSVVCFFDCILQKIPDIVKLKNQSKTPQ